ncbi:MAG: GNAT family N-acetyltransferase [Candidatus Omnitrophica bacterium]|nr:GNAT family N-acetyltransferase [Candidatus Omnitrophota bacterium]
MYNLLMMKNIKFAEVKNGEMIKEVVLLADIIWRKHYIPIVGQDQVDYMLEKFQSVEAITRQIQDDYHYYLIGDDANSYIGYFCVLIQGDKLFLNKIYLKLHVRGKGLGRETLNFIEEIAKSSNCSRVWLTVNKNNLDSIKVYQKCGYTMMGPYVQDIGQGFVMDDYELEKVL